MMLLSMIHVDIVVDGVDSDVVAVAVVYLMVFAVLGVA